jgi:hypothetical protein
VTNTTLEGLEPAQPGNSPAWQQAVYPLCLRRYRDRHRWMGELLLALVRWGALLDWKGSLSDKKVAEGSVTLPSLKYSAP